jgi:CPA2 family monovalent cation:H+ antiporter-2
VLAIARSDNSVVVPASQDRLQAGDIIALAGTHEPIDAAQALLDG